MTDVLTKKQRSYNMSMIKSKDTKAEIRLRKFLFSKRLRGYRIHSKVITGRPDIAFTRYKVAIFVDGCFWHKCPRCFIKPQTRKNFWKKKIEGNVKRDKEVNHILKKQGWKVIRFWEHEIKNRKKLNRCFDKILNNLKKKVLS